MNLIQHCHKSVEKYGGKEEDYVFIHQWFFQLKNHYNDDKVRIILYHSLGCYFAEQCLGTLFTNSSGKKVSTRDVAEQHIINELGTLPSVQQALEPYVLAPKEKVIKKTDWDELEKELAKKGIEVETPITVPRYRRGRVNLGSGLRD